MGESALFSVRALTALPIRIAQRRFVRLLLPNKIDNQSTVDVNR